MGKVSKLFPGEHMYLFEVKEDTRLQLLRYVNAYRCMENEELTKLMPAISYYICKEDRAFLFKRQKDRLESIMVLPVKRNSQLKGVLIVVPRLTKLGGIELRFM